jgi:hypothetical protein
MPAKVHIHGNCQSYVLAHMLKEACPDWDVTFYEVHAGPIIENLADYRERIATSDIVLSQPIHEGYRDTPELALSWVREHIKPGTALIVIPALHFSGHHPEFAGLYRLGDLCHNSLAAHLAMIGMPPDRSVELLLSPDLFADVVIRTEIELQLTEMNRREVDDGIEASVADIVTNEAVWFQMFHIVNHPMRTLCAHLLNRVFERLDTPQRIAISGTDYMDNPHIPMCPASARFCSGNGPAPPDWLPRETRVLMPNRHPAEVPDYLAEMMQQLSRHPAADIKSAIEADWRATAFLGRLAEAGAAIPQIDLWHRAA